MSRWVFYPKPITHLVEHLFVQITPIFAKEVGNLTNDRNMLGALYQPQKNQMDLKR